jgi:hypothetical protein
MAILHAAGKVENDADLKTLVAAQLVSIALID